MIPQLITYAKFFGLLGRAVQVDPIKPTLKAPGSKRLKLIFDGPLSNFAFKFNLRRYTWGLTPASESLIVDP